MEVRTYSNPAKLGEQIEVQLMEKEAENTLFLGLLDRFSNHQQLQKPEHFWFTVEEGNKIHLAGWRTPPFQFGIWSPVPNYLPAIECFIDYLKTHNLEVPGVVARKAIAEAFSEKATDVLRLDAYHRMDMGIFECRKVDQSLLGPGLIRPVGSEELDLLTDWMTAFHIDVLKKELLRNELEEQLKAEIEAGSYFFYIVDGKVVSTAAKSRPTKNGMSVTMVYTPPQYRKKGYATSCVAQLTQKLLADGWQFTSLFTDLSNPTSNSIYKKIGYCWVCDSAEIRLRPNRPV
jgi:predicted GNAT family acetyltransferase